MKTALLARCLQPVAERDRNREANVSMRRKHLVGDVDTNQPFVTSQRASCIIVDWPFNVWKKFNDGVDELLNTVQVCQLAHRGMTGRKRARVEMLQRLAVKVRRDVIGKMNQSMTIRWSEFNNKNSNWKYLRHSFQITRIN